MTDTRWFIGTFLTDGSKKTIFRYPARSSVIESMHASIPKYLVGDLNDVCFINASLALVPMTVKSFLRSTELHRSARSAQLAIIHSQCTLSVSRIYVNFYCVKTHVLHWVWNVFYYYVWMFPGSTKFLILVNNFK
jgi:hypothetical protein